MSNAAIKVGDGVSVVGDSGVPLSKVTSVVGDTVTMVSMSKTPPFKGHIRTAKISDVVKDGRGAVRTTF